MNAPNFNRRQFTAGLGAIVVAFSLDPKFAFGQETPRLPGSLQNNRKLDGWLRINPDGTATVFTGKVELGQGILTALAQIAAEELDLPLTRIKMISGDTGQTPNEGQTAGSQSVENSGTALRFACAEARDILVNAAAGKLGVAASALTVSDGACIAAGGRSVAYWDLVGDANLKREAQASVKPKPASEHRWVGKSVLRRDIPRKMTGGAAYVQDVRLPGMVFGRVVRPPSPGARLVSFDEAAAKRMPGVIAVVRDGDFLGVAAEREEQAIRARELLKKSSRWKESESLPPSGDALFEHLMTKAKSVDSVVSEKTSATAAAPARILNATYTRPFQVHGSIGPSCAVAQWSEGKLTVWTHSQGVFPLRGDLARVFATDPANIHCIHAEGAGCYGHNGADDVALDAALVARATGGRPVKLQWMSDDEFQWEPYGSAMVMKLSGGLDAKGNVVNWTHDVWSHPHNNRPGARDGVNLLASWHLEKPSRAPAPTDPPLPTGGGERNSIPRYDFPNQKVVKHFLPEMTLRTSALRTLGGYANVFALESFIDELASAAPADPVEFRLRHLKDPRAKAVIETAAQRAGWQANAKGDGERGRGFAFAKYKNLACYVAVVADVTVDRSSGKVRVARAVAAVDAGQIVNPDGVTNQIEGGIIQSTSWTLMESVRYDRTRVRTRSWADYPIIHFGDVPQVEVVLLDRPEERFLGVGEGSQGPAAAAIANALFNATGKRLRALPFASERVRQALA